MPEHPFIFNIFYYELSIFNLYLYLVCKIKHLSLKYFYSNIIIKKKKDLANFILSNLIEKPNVENYIL